MNLFDILGPVMVGPSSSHTAGAVRIGLLAQEGINVATLQLNRGGRGESAVMVIECDQPIPQATADAIRALPGILRVNRYTPRTGETI